jgi:hypothetical protein
LAAASSRPRYSVHAAAPSFACSVLRKCNSARFCSRLSLRSFRLLTIPMKDKTPRLLIVPVDLPLVKEFTETPGARMSDGYVVRGHRHDDAIRTASRIPIYENEHVGREKGFVTSLNRFVDRKKVASFRSQHSIFIERA